jgi:hypothetical protein
MDFGSFSLEADLFDTGIADRFAGQLPFKVPLESWGNELFGSIRKDLGSDHPVPSIPPGGLAYTNNGHYLCIFFGQTPAWPVEYIGQIRNDDWIRLVGNETCTSVTVTVLD